MKTGGLKSNRGRTRIVYVITKFNKPWRAFPSLAKAWLECFDQGFVVARGRHRPGTTAAHRKHRLDYGVHIIEATVTESPPWKRGEASKKRVFRTGNWIDEL